MKTTVPRLSGCRALGFLLIMAALLSGCAGAPQWGAWSKAPTPAQVAAVMGRVEAKQESAEMQNANPRFAAPDGRKQPTLVVTVP